MQKLNLNKLDINLDPVRYKHRRGSISRSERQATTYTVHEGAVNATSTQVIHKCCCLMYKIHFKEANSVAWVIKPEMKHIWKYIIWLDSLTAYKTRIVKRATAKSIFSFRCGVVISETLPESNEMDSYQLQAHNRDHFPHFGYHWWTVATKHRRGNSIHYTGLSNRGLDVIAMSEQLTSNTLLNKSIVHCTTSKIPTNSI